MNRLSLTLLLGLLLGLGVFPTQVAAQDQDGWLTHLALAGYVVTGFADVSQTAYCLGQGTCREVNPLARHAIARWGVVPTLTLKGAITTGVTAALLHDHQAHPRRTFWLALLAVSVQSLAVIHNARAMTRTPS